jgi:hypothetical protein
MSASELGKESNVQILHIAGSDRPAGFYSVLSLPTTEESSVVQTEGAQQLLQGMQQLRPLA